MKFDCSVGPILEQQIMVADGIFSGKTKYTKHFIVHSVHPMVDSNRQINDEKFLCLLVTALDENGLPYSECNKRGINADSFFQHFVRHRGAGRILFDRTDLDSVGEGFFIRQNLSLVHPVNSFVTTQTSEPNVAMNPVITEGYTANPSTIHEQGYMMNMVPNQVRAMIHDVCRIVYDSPILFTMLMFS